MHRFIRLSILLLITVFAMQAEATHLRSGQIIINQLTIGSRTCRITVSVYTNTINTSVLFGGTETLLDFGDGTTPITIPEIGPDNANYKVIDPVLGIATAFYTIEHTYATSESYHVSYSENNRNGSILNIDHPEDTPFFLESFFRLVPGKRYESPEFLAEPFFIAAIQETFSYSLAAKDTNDYSLFYKLSVPKKGWNIPVDNFRAPESLKLNSLTGLLTWDCIFNGTSTVGEYLFSTTVYQYDNTSLIGYTARDVQVILTDSELTGRVSDNAELNENNRVYIPEGKTKSIRLFAEDDKATEILFSVYSAFEKSNLEFTTYDSVRAEQKIKVCLIKLNSTNEILRNNPYIIIARAYFKNDDDTIVKDVAYSIYTRDVELSEPVVLSTEEKNVISIYPNPVRDFLKIDGITGTNVGIVTDQQGKAIAEQNVHDSIDLRSVSPGLYIVEIKNASRTILRTKIIKY
ncbi:MAG TPA: T9SS type A sorting domain-containing protein [Ohtaekwangia sp.]|uniref:T9SS type A sorting domain-containing protein n=1 Tax=Ohtaekwangia sp. TaxID=2066019 RepID=UPI002F937AA1